MTPLQIQKIQTYKKTLLTFDFIGIILIFAVAFSLRMNSHLSVALSQPILLMIVLVNLASLYIFGAYDIGSEIGTIERFLRVFFSILLGFGLFVGFIYLTRLEIYGILGRGVFLSSFFIFLLYAFTLRVFFHQRLQYLRTFRWNWLAFGDIASLNRLTQDAKKNTSLGQLETIVVEEADDFKLVMNRIKDSWAGIIIACKIPLPENVSNEFLRQRLNGLQMVNLIQIYEHFWGKLPVHFLENSWLLTTEGFSIAHNPVGLRIKRLMDILLSMILFLITWPIFIITMLFIKLDSPGPVFYRQIRTGKNGKAFSIIKFRSMTTDAEKNGAQWAQKSDARITRVGKWIRLTRIDELPQIFNVLKGEMSFIGPRPERPEFNSQLEKEIPYYQLRHLLSPGITGWAQVRYPYGASVEDAIEKLQYELYYIKNYSFKLDMIIILNTIKIVLFGKGR